MNTKTIDKTSWERMLLGGASALAAHVQELNALNVFPVADGDTGTNMLRTIEGGLAEAKKQEFDNLGAFSNQFARGILLSARGNSGVILSQIFAGINDVLKEYDTIGAKDLVKAYEQGVVKAYSAVQNPTEGTILTVFRESTECVSKQVDESTSIEDFFTLHIKEATRSLEATKTILPALAEADVVDSGGAGYLYVAQGMLQALDGREISYEFTQHKEESNVNIDLFSRDSVLEFGYCTEFLLRLTNSKCDPDAFEISTALSILNELGGESIVAYKQEDIIKVHVHTFNPGEILARMQAFGEFLTVKIENMNLGHTGAEKKKPSKPYSVVTVSHGDGLSALFTDMGADEIVSGGQSANPSIDDFITAFKKCDSKDILVLPNNKNIILAAKQAAELYTDAKVHVINTKNIAQGFGALSVITPGIKDIDSLVASAERAASDIIDGEITRAVRDVSIGGKDVCEGDYIAISEGEIVAVSGSAEDAVIEMLENADVDMCEIITLFAGKDVSAEARAELTERLQEIYEDYEITVYEGGQDVYDYFVAVE